MTLFTMITVLVAWLSLCLSQKESHQLTEVSLKAPPLLSRFNIWFHFSCICLHG